MVLNMMNIFVVLFSNFLRLRLFKNFFDELWVVECKKNVYVSFMICDDLCVLFIYLYYLMSFK